MYKIRAPHAAYDRKIGGLRFVNGVAETDNSWLASWFSGRPGFTVETDGDTGRGKRGQKRNDEGNPDGAGTDAASGRA